MERKKRSLKKKTEDFDYANFEKEAIEKLKAGKGLTGPEGALTGMIQRILQAALEGEMETICQMKKVLTAEMDLRQSRSRRVWVLST